MESRRLRMAMDMLLAPQNPKEVVIDFHEGKMSTAHLVVFTALLQWF